MRSPTAGRGLLAALLAGQFMANIDNAIVNVATPSIGATQATLVPLSAVVGVATFGGFYLSLAGSSGVHAAAPAFALVSVVHQTSTGRAGRFTNSTRWS